MQAFVRARVQPCETAPQPLHVQAAFGQIQAVQIADFQFAACRRLQAFGPFHGAPVIKIQPRHRPFGFRLHGLFFNGDGAKIAVQLHHAEAFGILHGIGEHGCAVRLRRCLLQHLCKRLSVKDIVAQHQANRVAVNKRFGNQQRLRQSFGLRLHGILQADAEIAAVAQQTAKGGLVFGRGNDQDVADVRQHQHGQRIINHGLVVHGQELLGNAARAGIQARAQTAGKEDAFHIGLSGAGCFWEI